MAFVYSAATSFRFVHVTVKALRISAPNKSKRKTKFSKHIFDTAVMQFVFIHFIVVRTVQNACAIFAYYVIEIDDTTDVVEARNGIERITFYERRYVVCAQTMSLGCKSVLNALMDPYSMVLFCFPCFFRFAFVAATLGARFSG